MNSLIIRENNKMKKTSFNKNKNNEEYKEELDYGKTLKNKPLRALNKKQERYIKAILNSNVVIAIGSAGTSKSYIPSVISADMFNDREVDNIVICRPMEGPGRYIGTLPGDKNEKMADWLTPITSTIKSRLGPGAFEYHVNRSKRIEFCPLNQIKGRSFEDTFLLADEAEDMDVETVKSLVTRIGENTKLVINGDVKQKHIKQDSGLSYIIKLVEKYNLPVPIIEFTLEECVRSKTTKMFLEAFEAEEED